MKSVVIKIRQSIYFALLLSFGTGFFYSCQDKVDESDMYAFTGMQIIDYLNTNDSTTYYAYLTTRVKLSKKSASTVADLLSARSNYTCFAPTNEAVQIFIDSVYNTTGYSGSVEKSWGRFLNEAYLRRTYLQGRMHVLAWRVAVHCL